MLAVPVRRRIDVREAVGYWISQLIGALPASAVVSAVAPAQTSPMTLSGHAVIAAFVAELLVTFPLCYVVLNIATSKDHPDNSFYGLAIGFTVRSPFVARSVAATKGERASSFRDRRRCNGCDG